jgi:hypothetical protein
VIVLAVPPIADFLELDLPPAELWAAMVVAVVSAVVALRFVPVTADGGDGATTERGESPPAARR